MDPLTRCVAALTAAVCTGSLLGCSAPHDAPLIAAASAQSTDHPPVQPTPPALPKAQKEHAAATVSSGQETTAATEPAPVTPPAPQQDAESEKLAEYKAPFPDRVDLFVPPKREGGAVSTGQGANESAVELMGFVRLDRQRALLSINGEISSMAEGDSQYGVEVISVHPPNVVLQRGRQRWQATLE